MTTMLTSAEVLNAAANARKQVITALGLVRRARADVETVRDTTDVGYKLYGQCSLAWHHLVEVDKWLGVAERDLRRGVHPAGLPENTGRIVLQKTGHLAGHLTSASRVMRTEALTEGRSFTTTWLTEADGAVAALVPAVETAVTLMERLASTIEVAVAADAAESPELVS